MQHLRDESIESEYEVVVLGCYRHREVVYPDLLKGRWVCWQCLLEWWHELHKKRKTGLMCQN